MKKYILFLIIAVLLSGCNENQPDITETAAVTAGAETSSETFSVTTTEETTQPTSATTAKNTTSPKETTVSVIDNNADETFPKLDGSTSTIPLETGIRAAFLNIPKEEAEGQIVRSKTHQAFEKFIDGKCDGLLTVPLSEEQETEITKHAIEVEMVPLAFEGFVFIVNIDNPVDSLTSAQLRKIYSGEITNWKEVGGDDVPIKAYQRNADSGSQNFMTAFMGDTPMMTAPKDFIAEAMGYMVDIVANYENGVNAIGYSVYTYAAEMYSADNGIKFIKIDGAEPSRENFKNGSYHAVGYTYLMFNKKQPENSPVRQLAAFLQTSEGIAVMENSGYATLDAPHLGLPEIPLNLLPANLVGTGIEKPKNHTAPVFEYTVDIKQNPRLKNKAVEKKITDDVKTFYPDLTEDEIWNFRRTQKSTYSLPTVKNGYLSIEDLTYDLYTGERLELTDLFFKGETFVPSLNESFKKMLMTEFYAGDGGGLFGARYYDEEMAYKPDFYGVEQGTSVMLWGFVLAKDGYYSTAVTKQNAYKVADRYFLLYDTFSHYNDGIDEREGNIFNYRVFVPSVQRDMKGIWENDNVVIKRFIEYKASDYNYSSNGIMYALFEDDTPLSEDVRKKANDYILSLTDEKNLKKFVMDNFVYDSLQHKEQLDFENNFEKRIGWYDTIKAYYINSCIYIHTGDLDMSVLACFNAETFKSINE